MKGEKRGTIEKKYWENFADHDVIRFPCEEGLQGATQRREGK